MQHSHLALAPQPTPKPKPKPKPKPYHLPLPHSQFRSGELVRRLDVEGCGEQAGNALLHAVLG